MKKENFNDSKEEPNIDKTIHTMDKKFKSLKNWAILLEGVMLVPLVIVFLILIISSIQLLSGNKPTAMVEIFNTVIKKDNYDKPATKADILKYIDNANYSNDDSVDYIKLNENQKIIFFFSSTIINYILDILLIYNLANIFKEVENKKTPFTETNIKRLDNIILFSKISLIITIISSLANIKNLFPSIGLAGIILIIAISYIFKYGYQLQKQSDETL